MSDYKNNHLSEEQVRDYAHTYSQGYFFNQWEFIEKEFLASRFEDLSGKDKKRYLDLACGRGRILSLAENYFSKTVGADISEQMLKHAADNCVKSELQHSGIEEVTCTEKYDVITMFRYFLNAEPPSRIKALEKVRELISDNGTFITNVHVSSGSIRGLVYRLRNWLCRKPIANTLSFAEFRDLLTSQGFEIQEVYWHSYFPRIGRYTDRISKYALTDFEKFCQKTSIVPETLCESFILICKVK